MVEKLSPISFEPNAFDHLVLPEYDKEFIRALVEVQKISGDAPTFENVIPGKGNGLVMLFHGSTAEAISEYLQLPLYKATSEDLDTGPGPEKIEAKLKVILEVNYRRISSGTPTCKFRILWALSAGPFLRLLEYHSGIVILTTNYFWEIDEAVKSRINFALRYKDLDSESRKVLWKKCLLLAGATIEPPNKAGFN
ncbi:hypothetical protein B0J17DRAFT_709985 [Rhizoctonia solani]|nr:hypothetical protein B0J17DRAFT_709985 [Rhizoctonia solani]